MKLKKNVAVLMSLLIGVLVSGCSFTAPRPTPEPIYVTATPVAVLESPTTEVTSVLGVTPDQPLDFPTLEPATNTPLPTRHPTLTPSFTVTFTESPVPKGTKVAPINCTVQPEGGFATIYTQDTSLKTTLGCAVGSAVAIQSATLNFETGSMVWASQFADVQTRMIYALYANGTYQRFDDNWVENVDPQTTGETAPSGRNTPIRGFGKVWHNNPTVKSGLGWAVNAEVGTAGQIQRFERGEMLFVASLGQTYIFLGGTNTWRINPTKF
ncbi:MAG: hypothetical protein ABI947_11710 [Chloroflexota bacterium]